MTARRLLLSGLAVVLAGCGTVPSPVNSPTASPGQSAAAESVSASPSAGTSLVGQIVFTVDDPAIAPPHPQIYIKNADGSNVRPLVVSTYADNGPSLSPDGRLVIFDRGYPNQTSRSFMVAVDGSGLHEFDPEGCAHVLGCVAQDVEGDAWSPDGRQIVLERVYARPNGDLASFGLWLVAVDGSGARQVTNHVPASHLEEHRASWSPDGRRLAFERIDSSVTPERSAIFTIGIDGKDLRQVTPWVLNANDPTWSPDGTLIAFQSPAEAYEQPGEQNIFVTRSDGTGLTQLTAHLSMGADGRQGTFHPVWSPDGTQILFTHRPASYGQADLFVMNRDGSHLHAVADTPFNEDLADWEPLP